jgi:hypothetical protein
MQRHTWCRATSSLPSVVCEWCWLSASAVYICISDNQNPCIQLATLRYAATRWGNSIVRYLQRQDRFRATSSLANVVLTRVQALSICCVFMRIWHWESKHDNRARRLIGGVLQEATEGISFQRWKRKSCAETKQYLTCSPKLLWWTRGRLAKGL